ncbi:MAG TPA: Gfo/Idh/MocA family oxidoreductase [Mycobacteriales bacterium]|nr:Gfo/Idh/MocA family oxidoreductase [Mycobacteriales bacterium]
MTGRRPLRVLVCGTGFGQFYLRAVRALEPTFELAGVLGRGGARSRADAERHGVGYFTDIAEVPADVDIACVVVRAAVAGGDGSELADGLLTRGIHVLQEQPVHSDEMAGCLRQARRHGVHYRVNSFYPHLEPVRRFLAAARNLRARQRPAFVDVLCASQVLYPAVDILGRALGGLRPWAFADPEPPSPRVAALADAAMPFRGVAGVLAGVPVTLRVQNQIHPDDPDNHAHLLHRVTLGAEGGVLTLADAHGPVLWHPRLHVRRDTDRRPVLTGPSADRLDLPSAVVLGAAEPRSFRRMFTEAWPDGVGRALRAFGETVRGEVRSQGEEQYQLTTSAVWLELTTRLGRPDLIRPAEPRPLSVADLTGEEFR